MMDLKYVSVTMPDALISGLDELVRLEMYPSRSVAIRAAVRDLLKIELWDLEPPVKPKRISNK